MATRAKRVCAKPGCFALAIGNGRCEVHQKPKHGWSKDYDAQRGSRHERGYTSKWERASKAYLKANPLCQGCYNATPRLLRPAVLVDHIIPHKGDMVIFWDVSNWQGLCTTCHAIKTGRGL